LEEQYDYILSLIEKLIDYGFDEFIIADLWLVILIRKKRLNCKIHLSGECEILNHYSINFYGQYDIKRIVFPRKISIDDMRGCIKNNNTSIKEFEAFMLNGLCKYSGGFCNSIHCDNMPGLCSVPNKIQMYNPNIDEEPFLLSMSQNMKREAYKKAIRHHADLKWRYKFAESGCGICSIKRLNDIGITHLKIVGRGSKIEKLINDIDNLKYLVNISEQMSELEFVTFVKKNYAISGCEKCYYPEKKGEKTWT
jgi:collagenase-like PrtC family protease